MEYGDKIMIFAVLIAIFGFGSIAYMWSATAEYETHEGIVIDKYSSGTWGARSYCILEMDNKERITMGCKDQLIVGDKATWETSHGKNSSPYNLKRLS